MTKKRKKTIPNKTKDTSKDDFPKLKDEFSDLELEPIISDLPKDKQESLLRVLSVVKKESLSFSGPLPHPDILQGYKDVVPGAAERILAMAEKQAEHRQKIESKVINKQLAQTSLGQWFAFILTIVCIAVGTYLAVNNFTIIAGIIFSSTILGLISVFVLGKRPRIDKKEDQ